MISQTIHTSDPKMLELLKIAANAAASKATVLIMGESGTGKELLARYIHSQSPRSSRAFVAVNCAAVPEGLIESELFGHEKGAFTGAHQTRVGRFELANEGTFLLDEVSELPLLLQAKLLRVIQEGELTRVGGTRTIRVNVRLVATCNRSLKEMVKQGLFREDLYYRLNVFPIGLPALRDRESDITELAERFCEVSSERNERKVSAISESALMKLKSWSWPGNIRELQNVIERAVIVCQNGVILPDDIKLEDDILNEAEQQLVSTTRLSTRLHESSQSKGILRDFSLENQLGLKPGFTIGEVEKLLILKTLEYTAQNRTQAADLLGISIRTLRNKINLYREVKNG
jgi:two-component system, response regulator FlrC